MHVDFPMSWALPVRRTEWALSLLSVTGLLATVLAVGLIWLFLTEPLEVARVVNQGGSSELARLIATTVYDLVRSVFDWL